MADEAKTRRGRLAGALRRIASHRAWRPVLGAAVLVLAGFLLYRVLHRYSFDEIVDSVRQIPAWRLALAGLFAAGSYACLTLFDTLAVRYVGKRLRYRYIAMTSFSALSIGHNIGFAALSSGAIRYRLYARRGLDFATVARIIAFCALTVGLGLTILAGAALCLAPGLAAELLRLSRAAAIGAGIACLAAAAGYLLLCARLRRPLHLWKWQVELPTLRLALAQAVVGPLNFALVAACLHQLLAGIADVAYPGVATAYVLANVAALVSHVPGGLGVIESVVVLLLPGERLIGALIAFRLVYYLLPLPLGALTLLAAELFGSRTAAKPLPADA